MDEQLREWLGSLRELFPELRSVVLFRDSLEPVGGLSPEPRILDGFSLAGKVPETRCLDDPLVESEPSAMVAPVKFTRRPDYYLYVGAAKPGVFTAFDRLALSLAADQLARLLSRQGEDRLTLTELPGHGIIQQRLGERVGQECCLGLIEVDGLRHYNETLGFGPGDALLHEVALAIQDKVRSQDLVARWSGARFAICFEQLGLNESARLCERVRESFLLRFGGNKLPVTASLGLAGGRDFSERSEWVEACKLALETSMSHGGNRLTVVGRQEDEGEGGAGQPARLPGGPKGPRSASESRQPGAP